MRTVNKCLNRDVDIRWMFYAEVIIIYIITSYRGDIITFHNNMNSLNTLMSHESDAYSK